ncbi:MAG: TlpA family protein disulfide reductase [Reichenbachiella sp.]
MKTRTYLSLIILVLVTAPLLISCDEEPEEIVEMKDTMEDMIDDAGDDGDETDIDAGDDTPDDGGSETNAGDAPDFILTSVNGGEVSLSDFIGKPIVIFFFGSTCPLCVSSAPNVESKIKQAFTSDEIAIIGIDTWNGNTAAVENFKSSTGITFDLLLDGSGVQADYSTTYDRLFLIDSLGDIAHKGGRAAGTDAQTVADLITAML